MKSKEPVWMSYAEAEAHRKLMHRREQEFLRSQGLGWLIDFCSKPKTDELQDIHTSPEQFPNS